MSHKFPSEEWTVAYAQAVNANAKYREAAAQWTYGPVAMVIAPDPSLGIEEETGMILDVHEGRCRKTEYRTGPEAFEACPFVIVAPYARWKEIIGGETDPIKAMMQGKLRLRKGHLPTIIRFVEGSRQLVASASQVPTEFLQ